MSHCRTIISVASVLSVSLVTGKLPILPVVYNQESSSTATIAAEAKATAKAKNLQVENVKIIHFVRHAEGHHNVAGKKDPVNGYLNPALIDAVLTVEGIEQCTTLASKAKDLTSSSQLVVVSPMNRAIQTAQLSFPHLQQNVPWIALEEIRERTGLHWCDKRYSISVHKQLYRGVNFDHVISDEDPLFHKYNCREPDADIIARAQTFVNWLAQRPEREIVVVSHSGFLAFLLQDVMKIEDSNDSSKFENCEIRSFLVSFER